MIKQSVAVAPRVGLIVIAAALASACSAFGTPTPAGAPVGASEPDATTPSPAPAPAPRDPALERRIAALELELMLRNAQVSQLQARLREAQTEVVRAMGRMQSLATRAEAASGMAEAEIALQALPGSATTGSAADASAFMAQSVAEFEKQNYGGALYLANEAKDAASAARAQVADTGGLELRPGEDLFDLPLTLETTTGANVRNGPGTGFDVLFVLQAGAALTAHSSSEQWLRVTDGSGRRGWISQSIIRQRP